MSNETKNVGVAVDNWKIARFTRELKKLGFTDIEIRPSVEDTSIIAVLNVPVARVHDIHEMCRRVQRDLHNRN